MARDNLFFTSDTHWGHTNIIKYCNRPFDSLEEMDEVLIENWNRVVPKKGIVYHLGDIFICNQARARQIRMCLNGKIHLIIGNHDKTATTNGCKDLFSSVSLYKQIKVDDPSMPRGHIPICLFHYPIASWEKRHHGAWSLNGHSHGEFKESAPCRWDVGVDAVARLMANYWHLPKTQKQDYSPISCSDLLDLSWVR